MGLLGKFKNKKEDEVKTKKPNSSGIKTEDKKVDSKKIEKEVVSKKTPAKKTTKTKVTGNAGKIFVRPFISEKAAIAETNGVYTFVVEKDASKVDIKNAIKQVYGIEPKKVRVMNMEGKAKRYGRNRGRRSDWKKAVITLPKGQSISIHEGV